MRVGVYIDRMDLRGGAQRVVSNLCHGWNRRGWDVYLLVVSGDASAFPVPSAVKRHALAARHKRRGLLGAWDNWHHARALGEVVRAERLDAVLAVSAVANVHLAQADLPAHVVRVGSEHSYSPHFPLPFYKEWFRRRAYPKLDAVVCPTREAADYLAKTYPGTRTQGIPNWLTWPLPPGDGAKEVRIGRPGRKAFLACGRFDKLKGFSRLIAMFDGLKERLPDWDLVLVGDGEDRDLLQAQVAKAKLVDRVYFPGWVADMETAFRSADLFVFPTKGPSGPTTTMSIPNDLAHATMPDLSITSHSILIPNRAVPGLPGKKNNWGTRGDCDKANPMACSRPPDPTTIIFIFILSLSPFHYF